MLDRLKEGLERAGFVHHSVDLSQCSTPDEAVHLLEKSDARFKGTVKHKSGL